MGRTSYSIRIIRRRRRLPLFFAGNVLLVLTVWGSAVAHFPFSRKEGVTKTFLSLSLSLVKLPPACFCIVPFTFGHSLSRSLLLLLGLGRARPPPDVLPLLFTRDGIFQAATKFNLAPSSK
jgi:hypothetical protein